MNRSTTGRIKNVDKDNSFTTLNAAAYQDHLLRSIGHLTLSDPLRLHKIPGTKRRNYKKEVKSVVDSGLTNKNQSQKKQSNVEKEYVLDSKPPPATLAQKLGLFEAPKLLLTEKEWGDVKSKSNEREDSKDPCVICKEDFGTQQQVLLSCSHVFHRNCLEAFERFSGKKSCPMCRREQYQTRVIHEGAREFRHKCATVIQSHWRGYVVRCWYHKLRESVPPKDPKLRQKYYEDKLSSITERMIRSIDFDVNGFLREIDHSLEASRDIFKNFDNMLKLITEEQWEEIQLRAVTRGETDCPICLTALDREGVSARPPKAASSAKHTSAARKPTHLHTTQPTNNNGQPIKRYKLLPKIGSGVKGKRSASVRAEKSSDVTGEESCNTVSDDHRDTLIKQKALLSCSHVFHMTCLQTFEELSEGDRKFTCPVCRSNYQKRII